MSKLKARLEKLENFLRFKSPKPASKYSDQEMAAIADIMDEIQGLEYSNVTGHETYKFPDGFVCFRNGEIFYCQTGERFSDLSEAQKKYPGIQVIPAAAELTENLFNALESLRK